jgi:hypothetical protein
MNKSSLLMSRIFFFVSLIACCSSLVSADSDVSLNDNAGTRIAYVDWQDGLTDAISVQANPGDIAIIPDPVGASRRVLRLTIAKAESYTHVANGTPRAELLFHDPATFAQGSEYLVRWSTYIPRNFEFDGKQMLIISQIHQSAREGSPTVALTLLGESYYISTRGGPSVQKTTAGTKICCADADRGKWIHWTLRYVPDDSGQRSLTQLWKNGASEFCSAHVANSYPNDQHAYLKIGLYKSAWKKEPSDVDTQTLFYGPVSIVKH